jgi:predicted ArsR family transcriptional regulator
LQVRTTEVSSRLGDFTVIKLGQAVLISPCDTRMKILTALAEGPLTSDQIRRKIRVSYSAVMDHMDFLERIGVVKATLVKRNGARKEGRRRIQFHLSENPLEGIEELFLTSKNSQISV